VCYRCGQKGMSCTCASRLGVCLILSVRPLDPRLSYE
jgi:hypothetical protein